VKKNQNGSESEIIEYLLDNAGFNVDHEVPEELFVENQSQLYETNRSIVNQLNPEAKTMRDDKSRRSLHLTDYRNVERDKKVSNIIVGHVEHFNPEKHPILHAIIDTPLWFIKNRILRKNNL